MRLPIARLISWSRSGQPLGQDCAPRGTAPGAECCHCAEALERRLLLATVSGFKFHDVNGNSVRDAGEPFLPDWIIYHDLDNDDVRDPGEAFDTTDAGGAFSLTVPAGSGIGGTFPTLETIREVPQGGWRVSFPAVGEHVLLLTSGANGTNINFGNTHRGLVTGTKFNDLDVDGVCDEGEPGLEGWTIYADLDDDGVLDAGEPRDVTGPSGTYALNLGSSATPYVIREMLQAEWGHTLPATGSYTVSLGQGETASGRHFGNTRRGTVSGVKYNDMNGDGLRGPAEPGLPGWRIYLDTNDNNIFDGDDPNAVTDESGNYSIIVNGSATVYALREVPQTGWLPTTPSAYSIVIAPGDREIRNFANTQLGLIRGQKWYDRDADGVISAGDQALSGWTIYADVNDNGVFDAGEPSDVTDGGFYFIRVPYLPSPRTYTVREVLQAGWRQTFPSGGHSVTFDAPGQTQDNRHFLNTNRRVINGTKYNDVNANGTRDPIVPVEPGLPRWTIYADLNNDNVLDPEEPSDVTDDAGNYRLIVPPGEEDVTVREVPEDGWRQTEPPAPPFGTGEYVVTIGSGGIANRRDFGNTRRGLITGVKYDDADADGVHDAGEAPLRGWTIYLDLDSDDTLDPAEPNVLTGATGRYSFDVNATGDYTVRELLPAPGWRATNPTTGEWTVSFGPGSDPTPLRVRDFLNTRRIHFSGFKYNDLNADGIRQAAEPGLEGWTIYHDANDNNVLDAGETSDVTGSDGSFVIQPPAPASMGTTIYPFREVGQPGWRQTAPGPALPEGEYRLTLFPGQFAGPFLFGNTYSPQVTGVFARGSSWAGNDGNPATTTFMEYLRQERLGDDAFGYRVRPGDALPWVNLNQLVLEYTSELPISPLPARVVIHGVRSNYDAVPSIVGPRTLLLTLDRVFGAQPGGGENGDWITLIDDFIDGDYRLRFNVVQGDVNKSGSVLANDYSEVKQRFFQNTTHPAYSPFHDVDGSGSVLANDYSAVKGRFFDNLPPPPPQATALFSSMRIRPLLRPDLAGLLG